jgi:ribonuclease P protein component
LAESNAHEPPSGTGPAQRGKRYEAWMRMRTKREYDRAYACGSRARGAHYTVLAAPGEVPGRTRLGLAIAKRIWKRAVRRNRVRRILREAFRLEYDALPSGVDLVVMGTEPRIDPDLETARRELVELAHHAWRRAQRRTERKR